MNSINKNDLIELLNYALDEYGDPRHMSTDLMRTGHASMAFGSLSAEIKMVEAKKNALYLRQYTVNDNNGNCLSFLLGHSAVLFSNSAKKFREQLVSDNSVKGVITLKREVFKQITIPAAIIMLGENIAETWFTSVDSVDSLLETFCDDFSSLKRVYYSKNISAQSLNPEYYNGDDKAIEESFKGSQTKPLGEIAELIIGKAAKKEQFSDNGISYLRGRDLQNGKIMKPELYINADELSSFANCILQEGDILLTKNFGQNKLAFVTENDLPAIASNGLIIIRAYDVSEKYLYSYFTSQTGNEVFNKQLFRIQRGLIPNITISDLKEVIIPILDSDTIEEMENYTTITKETVINTAKRLFGNMMIENHLESVVYEELLNAGWKKESLVQRVSSNNKYYAAIGEKINVSPDLAYLLDDGRLIFVEIKLDLMCINKDWVNKMKSVLGSNHYAFIMITTGTYYEIHKPGVDSSLKLLKAPTIDAILDWEKEVF